MVLAYAFCNVSVMPVKSEPSHRSEQVNQLLFGEKLEVLELDNKDWARIRSGWDDYEGWCKLSQLKIVYVKEYRKEVKYLAAGHSSRLLLGSGEMWLPLGSEISGMKSGRIIIGNDAGKFKGKKVNLRKAILTGEAIREAAMQYLHAPYLWGGRNMAGIDCSGLTQMAYKLCNCKIPRDASQQAKVGQLVDFLQNAQCGDLAFFDDREGKIVHVGLLLDNQTILHAADTAGRVVIDRVDQGGIISVLLKKRTHNLRMVRRII